MFRARPNFRPTEVSAKVQTTRPITRTTRETSRGRPSQRHATPRTTKAREPGNKPRGRATFRVPRPMHPSEPGKNVPRPAENFIGQIYPLDHAADRESVRPRPFRLATTRLSGRSSRTTVPTPRSTRSPF
ncbi:unnamed protein product [Microthlaspi erraticum]|uniref:Uncharacterized protein n=1 Tax=Microthlaspi erraticum TaxID=1685480 RepID=A0A6D2J7E4_9BRAS|nr:unnamed protein product [Microthlaspi erraticum]